MASRHLIAPIPQQARNCFHMQIRALTHDDFPNWLPLWIENNLGQNNADITAQTWQRLTNTNSNIHGLCAVKSNHIAGFVHFITHPTTGALTDACYMQDVFVAPQYRNQGIASALIKAVIKHAKSQNYSRLYWMAEKNNQAAQKLYEKIAQPIDFSVHVLPL